MRLKNPLVLRTGNVYFFAFGCLSTLVVICLTKWFLGGNYFGDNQIFTQRKKLAVVFGDSISQHGFNPDIHGWVGSLSHFWSRRVDIVNRGFSGYNSRWGLSIMKEVVISLRPDMVLIFFGANDAVVAGGSTYVSLNEYQKNIEQMVIAIGKTLPLAAILLITPPPIGEEDLQRSNLSKGKEIILDRTNERTMTYADACVSVGAKLNVPVLNIWAAMGGLSPSRTEYLSDGLHLNSQGNAMLFEELKKSIELHFPDWMPQRLPLHQAEWVQLVGS